MGLPTNSLRGQRLVSVSDWTDMGIVFITYFVVFFKTYLLLLLAGSTGDLGKLDFGVGGGCHAVTAATLLFCRKVYLADPRGDIGQRIFPCYTRLIVLPGSESQPSITQVAHFCIIYEHMKMFLFYKQLRGDG